MPMIKPRIRPHRLGSSRKFPRRDCSQRNTPTPRPGIRSMRKLQSHAEWGRPHGKALGKGDVGCPGRAAHRCGDDIRQERSCSTTISRAAVRPHHISPVSCCTSTPAKAACHRLHSGPYSAHGVTPGRPASAGSAARRPGSTQYRISLFSVTSAAFCQCRSGLRPGGKGIGIDHGTSPASASWPLSVLMSSWMATVLPSTASAHWPER